MFTIEGHTYKRAADANRVALLIGADCHDMLWAGREGLALEVDAIAPGESRAFPRIPWQGETRTGPIVVTRAA